MKHLTYFLLPLLAFPLLLPAQDELRLPPEDFRGFSVSAQGALYIDGRGRFGWSLGGALTRIRGRHIFSFSYRYLRETPQQDFLGPLMEQYDLYTLLYGRYYDWKENIRLQAQVGIGRMRGYERRTLGEGLYNYSRRLSWGIPLRLQASYMLGAHLSVGLKTLFYISKKRMFYLPLLHLEVGLLR